MAANRRMVREHNERITAAYYAAVIPLAKQIPSLRELLADQGEAPQQTMDEQIAVAQQWAALTS